MKILFLCESINLDENVSLWIGGSDVKNSETKKVSIWMCKFSEWKET